MSGWRERIGEDAETKSNRVSEIKELFDALSGTDILKSIVC